MSSTKTKRLIVLVGPTAVGKTSVAIWLAQQLKTEIISADSRQFYKEMSIGTATPTAAELQAVPHHLIGHLSVKDYYNISEFEQDALKVINVLHQTHDDVIMVGGSGLYIDALCNGIDDIPSPDPALRSSLQNTFETEGITALQRQLKTLDSEYYNVVDIANYKRLMRAIEVCLQTGLTFTEIRTRTKKPRPFSILKIGLDKPREELFAGINNRVDQMMLQGLEAEVKSLYDYKNLNALKTVGYRELFAYMDGEYSLQQAIENIKTNTRRYAKRQLTWFRRDDAIHWFNPEDQAEILKCCE